MKPSCSPQISLSSLQIKPLFLLQRGDSGRDVIPIHVHDLSRPLETAGVMSYALFVTSLLHSSWLKAGGHVSPSTFIIIIIIIIIIIVYCRQGWRRFAVN
jgi:hypothetical protein